MNAITVPVSERSLMGRVNRALEKDGKIVKTARDGTRLHVNFGRFYIVNRRLNSVTDKHINLEKFAREVGCLSAWEKLED